MSRPPLKIALQVKQPGGHRTIVTPVSRRRSNPIVFSSRRACKDIHAKESPCWKWTKERAKGVKEEKEIPTRKKKFRREGSQTCYRRSANPLNQRRLASEGGETEEKKKEEEAEEEEEEEEEAESRATFPFLSLFNVLFPLPFPFFFFFFFFFFFPLSSSWRRDMRMQITLVVARW